MIASKFDDNTFFKEMSNVVKYAEGYLEGVKLGKPGMLAKMGLTIKTIMEEYIDTNARVDPASLHHVYEWYRTGSPEARLFDISYTVYAGGLTIKSTFSQSRSLASGSTTPFYNKATIMENGIPVTIRPKRSGVLVFDDNGNTIFTKGPVTVDNPGGDAVEGSFEDVANSFFSRYFAQSYLYNSGFSAHLKNPIDFKAGFARAKTGGKSLGKQIGYNWIVKAGDKL